MTAQYAFVWWLMPAEPFKSRLQECIRTVSERYGDVCPCFEPHITLSPPQALDDGDDRNKLPVFPSWEESIRIPKSQFRMEIGSTFTQSVLLHIISADNTALLWELRKRLVANEEDIHKDRFPHLSLVYCNGDSELRRQIADSISLESILPTDNDDEEESSSCLFDAVQCMKIRLPVSNAEDVRQWRVLKRIQLRKSLE